MPLASRATNARAERATPDPDIEPRKGKETTPPPADEQQTGAVTPSADKPARKPRAPNQPKPTPPEGAVDAKTARERLKAIKTEAKALKSAEADARRKLDQEYALKRRSLQAEYELLERQLRRSLF